MHRSQQSVSDSNFELSPVADLDVVAEDASLTRYNQTHLTPRDHSSGKRRSTCSRQYGSVKRACSARSTAIVPPSQQAIIPSNALDENVHIVCDWPPTFPYHGSALAARLAPELLSDIFERLVLQLNTHNSLPQLCLVSKRWRQAAARILYRNPCLDGRWFLPEGEHPAAPRSNVTKLLDTLAASNQSYLSATLSLELPLGHFVRKLDLADGEALCNERRSFLTRLA
ncbi:hypothetical protein DFJ73DRAFT_10339 [Zopfochytrium polystomum]|nr:hypothetical protein DFJ73DRAFT_10339 [Zopfochytrium polystomum]